MGLAPTGKRRLFTAHAINGRRRTAASRQSDAIANGLPELDAEHGRRKSITALMD
jgi:hypothetical protein